MSSATRLAGHPVGGLGTGIFDAVHPPARDHVLACVHCGFCLPSCPTYVLWGHEPDSPRGRIQLMHAGLDGRIAMSAEFVDHIDACLGCLACVTACPSGVDYASLIESTRAQIERHHVRRLGTRLLRATILSIVPYPDRLAAVAWTFGMVRAFRALADRLGFFGRLPSRVRTMLRLVPRSGAVTPGHHLRYPATGERRLTVGLVTGCVQRTVFGDVNRATVDVLTAEGCDVVTPVQGCCGALELHTGLREAARARARRLIDVFRSTEFERIVVNVAGCGSAMKDYGRLFADDAEWAEPARRFSDRVRDVSEILAELGPARAPRHPLSIRVAYHDACHLGHAQSVREQPREMLSTIPGVTIVPLAEPDICCGSAGLYNLTHPEPAAALGQRKARHVAAIAPDVVATGNAGCLLQIAAALDEAGQSLPVLHPIQIVHASILGRSVTS